MFASVRTRCAVFSFLLFAAPPALPQADVVPDAVATLASSRAADCPPGYTNNGLTCDRGADSIPAGSRVANCPSGFKNMGLTCYRGPDTYAKGCTTIFRKYPCRKGYTDNGCFCGRGATSLGTSSMSCPTGYFLNKSLGRCYKNCPSGYTNTGETCYRAPSTLGMDSMTCLPGESRSGPRCSSR